VTTLRFRVIETPLSASLISQLRKLTSLSISEIRYRATAGQPVMELSAFSNTWQEDRAKLVDVADRIESDELPLVVTEVYESGTESPVSNEMLRNLIAQFRHIELETQRDTMLELGEIDDPAQFQPYDDDWTQ
jgi:hypothetical protein